MDHLLAVFEEISGSIPHTRGDGPNNLLITLKDKRYSPHAWGWTVQGGGQDHPIGVFPTRVGMDRLGCEGSH